MMKIDHILFPIQFPCIVFKFSTVLCVTYHCISSDSSVLFLLWTHTTLDAFMNKYIRVSGLIFSLFSRCELGISVQGPVNSVVHLPFRQTRTRCSSTETLSKNLKFYFCEILFIELNVINNAINISSFLKMELLVSKEITNTSLT